MKSNGLVVLTYVVAFAVGLGASFGFGRLIQPGEPGFAIPFGGLALPLVGIATVNVIVRTVTGLWRELYFWLWSVLLVYGCIGFLVVFILISHSAVLGMVLYFSVIFFAGMWKALKDNNARSRLVG